jgi:hypothetical protein
MYKWLSFISIAAAFAVACGGQAFTTESPDGAIPRDGGESHDSALGEAGPKGADSGVPFDSGSADDAARPVDSGESVDSGVADDSATGDSATGDSGKRDDAGECTGVDQCDDTHPCPKSGGKGVCCAPLTVVRSCGTCSLSGICPQ